MADGDRHAPTLPRPLEEIRAEFPILARQVHGQPLAYLDNGATAQKPLAVIDTLDRYWREHNANVHRGVHTLSEEATALYEGARGTIARHLARRPREVIFTRNVTGSSNLVAHAWGRANVGDGDRILVTEMEHHSNIVPWYLLAKEVGAKLDWVPSTATGASTWRPSRPPWSAVRSWSRSPTSPTCSAPSTLSPRSPGWPTRPGRSWSSTGPRPRRSCSSTWPSLGADFYGFTGHKVYGPTGVGVLYGRGELLEAMPPFKGGGSMIRKVTKERITWADVPARFEAGTPPIAEAIGLGRRDRVVRRGRAGRRSRARGRGRRLRARAPGRGSGVRIFGPPAGDDRVGIVSFDVDGVHPHDVSEILDRHAIAVRAGHHCAQVLMDRLGVAATTRASLAVYNTREEVDRLVEALHDVRRVFELD